MDTQIIDRYIEDILAQSAPDRPLWNIEKIRQGKVNGWNYIDGCMMMGLLELHAITGREDFAEFAGRYVDYYVAEDGALRGYREEEYNLDNICEGRVLFDLYKMTGKEKYRLAEDKLFAQLQHQPRTFEGSFWHKKIYPDQVWLDGLFMAQVFYARYLCERGAELRARAAGPAAGLADRAEGLTDPAEGFADITRQFKTVRARMFDEASGLYRHGYDASHRAFWAGEDGCSRNPWLRSLGWFCLALIDVLSYAGIADGAAAVQAANAGEGQAADGREGTAAGAADSVTAARKELTSTLTGLAQEIARNLLRYIDPESGMLFQVPDRIGAEGNYPETSGSAMIACFFLKGARLGILDAACAEKGRAVFEAICDRYLTKTDDGLTLGGICLVAGLGPEDNRRRDGSYEYYISEPVVENDAKGLGPFLLCYTEILRLQAEK